MSPPSSDLIRVQAIPHAGLGVVVACNETITANTLILRSRSPEAHVILREYRREVCAWCFHYDRGRTLPVRDGETGKVFCSPECLAEWESEHGERGVQAWKGLYEFISKKKNKSKKSKLREKEKEAPTFDSDRSLVGSEVSRSDRPSIADIDAAWKKVESQVQQYIDRTTGVLGKSTKSSICTAAAAAVTADPDILSVFLDGLLNYHRNPDKWVEAIQSLAQNETPYSDAEDLSEHCNSFIALAGILSSFSSSNGHNKKENDSDVNNTTNNDNDNNNNNHNPSSLLTPFAPRICRLLISSASHNAFGLRSGSSIAGVGDEPGSAEEYMGWAIYSGASFFNHSCAPNIRKQRVGRNWEFRAVRDLVGGEECCITYLGGDEREMDVWERRKRLSEVWGFDCMCERCARESGSGLISEELEEQH